ncbi:hypothetical protein GGF32_002481 [Allomyces javanicus]|nr:hypothetical protein GGF32_002481 [Allomyces javanicus]
MARRAGEEVWIHAVRVERVGDKVMHVRCSRCPAEKAAYHARHVQSADERCSALTEYTRLPEVDLVDDAQPSFKEWHMLRLYTPLPEPFKKAAVLLSGGASPTLALGGYLITELLMVLDAHIRETLRLLAQDWNTRVVMGLDPDDERVALRGMRSVRGQAASQQGALAAQGCSNADPSQDETVEDETVEWQEAQLLGDGLEPTCMEWSVMRHQHQQHKQQQQHPARFPSLDSWKNWEYAGGRLGAPHLLPTMDEFDDFKAYVTAVKEKFGSDYGMVKITAPAEWIAKLPNVRTKLGSIGGVQIIAEHFVKPVDSDEPIYRFSTSAFTELNKLARPPPPEAAKERTAEELEELEELEEVVMSTISLSEFARLAAFAGLPYLGNGFVPPLLDALPPVASASTAVASPQVSFDWNASGCKVVAGDGRAEVWRFVDLNRLLREAKKPGDEPAYTDDLFTIKFDQAQYAYLERELWSNVEKQAVDPGIQDDTAVFTSCREQHPARVLWDPMHPRTVPRASHVPPSVYAADIDATLFDDTVQHWNPNELDNVLTHVWRERMGKCVAGINTPFLYFGAFGSFFAAHVEDADLYAYSYLHFGAPKFWYGYAARDFDKICSFISKHYQDECDSGNAFRHKVALFDPDFLEHMAGME